MDTFLSSKAEAGHAFDFTPTIVPLENVRDRSFDQLSLKSTWDRALPRRLEGWIDWRRDSFAMVMYCDDQNEFFA